MLSGVNIIVYACAMWNNHKRLENARVCSPEENGGQGDESVEDVAEELPEAEHSQEAQGARDLEHLRHEEQERRERHALVRAVHADRQVDGNA